MFAKTGQLLFSCENVCPEKFWTISSVGSKSKCPETCYAVTSRSS